MKRVAAVVIPWVIATAALAYIGYAELRQKVTDYDSCILEHVSGGMNQLAVKLVEESCDRKFQQ